MRVVRTASSNFVWMGPRPDIGDLHARVARDASGAVAGTFSVWEPTQEERAAIAAGANVQLGVIGIHPPVSLSVTAEQGVGEDAPEHQARLEEWRRREGQDG